MSPRDLASAESSIVSVRAVDCDIESHKTWSRVYYTCHVSSLGSSQRRVIVLEVQAIASSTG